MTGKTLKLLFVVKGQICPPRIDSVYSNEKASAMALLASYSKRDGNRYWEPPTKFCEYLWAIVEDIAPVFNQYDEVCP